MSDRDSKLEEAVVGALKMGDSGTYVNMSRENQ